MKALLRISAFLMKADGWALSRGAALSVLVLCMGAALLGLSGWFIIATGMAGLTGVGSTFDVFRPSAGVRFLALGRAAARYGERLLTHDATLRALAALRVILLARYATLGAREITKLRQEGGLTQIIADVDALDGVLLRLVLPVCAAILTHVLVFGVFTWLVGWETALLVATGYGVVGGGALWWFGRQSLKPSAEGERLGRTLYQDLISMRRDHTALILAGRLAETEFSLLALDGKMRSAAKQLDRQERGADLVLKVLIAGVAVGALIVGAAMLDRAVFGPATAVIGFFVALALAEAVPPLRRGFSDLGRILDAARRVAPDLLPEHRPNGAPPLSTKPLLTIHKPGLTVDLDAGDCVALVGASGAGKSTLLFQIAGVAPSSGVKIRGVAPDAWPEPDLRRMVAMLPQRSALISGSIRDNLLLAGEYEDDRLWEMLRIVALDQDLAAQREGLETHLGEGGSGLSGGQSRRVALARTLLKNPDILLLDEPTEGVDPETARQVLRKVRASFPETLILIAQHAEVDAHLFDRVVQLAP
jgi:ATP-binding cassette subfamily C protein CydC